MGTIEVAIAARDQLRAKSNDLQRQLREATQRLEGLGTSSAPAGDLDAKIKVEMEREVLLRIGKALERDMRTTAGQIEMASGEIAALRQQRELHLRQADRYRQTIERLGSHEDSVSDCRRLLQQFIDGRIDNAQGLNVFGVAENTLLGLQQRLGEARGRLAEVEFELARLGDT